MIKAVLLDYGGTIDTNGIHWAELLWNSYCHYKIPVSKEMFTEAYIFGEKSLAIHPLVKPQHNFLEVLTIKLHQQFNYLYSKSYLDTDSLYKNLIVAMANDCNAFAATCVAKAKSVLEEIAKDYVLVLVSNFYGNIQSVLKEYGIFPLFTHIIESAVVGVRKPSPEIWSLGVRSVALQPNECIAIGDSYKKDILPAKQAGCKTIWLKGQGWEEETVSGNEADIVIKSLQELPQILHQPNSL